MKIVPIVLLLAPIAACTATEEDELLGEAEVEITSVPSGVQCIHIGIEGDGSVIGRSFPVTTGASPVTLALGALPTGLVQFIGTAYNASCPDAASAPAGDPSWIAEPIVADVVPGIPETLAFEFRRNAPGTGTADFQDTALTIAPAQYTTLSLMADGTLRGWGNMYSAEFGMGATNELRARPGTAGLGLSGLVGVATGAYHVCAWDAARLWCWGSNSSGQIGDGTTTLRTTPTLVNGPWTTAGISSVSLGSGTSCLIAMDGRTYCWGSNYAGEAGQPSTTSRVLVPTDVGGYRYQTVSVGGGLVCGVTQGDGTVSCWGRQLGTTGGSNYPVATAMRAAVDVSVGSEHVCAVRADGTVWCWGYNTYGQLGNSVTGGPMTTTPVQVIGIDDAIAVTITPLSSCALRVGGNVSCWGYNAHGQLGDGTGVNSAVPVAVRNLTNVVDLRASRTGNTVCASLADGEGRCWGSGPWRQIGDGGTSNRFIPAKVDF